jgi:hypothetical protein
MRSLPIKRLKLIASESGPTSKTGAAVCSGASSQCSACAMRPPTSCSASIEAIAYASP